MSSARSSFLSCGCCFSESHSAFLFPSVYPFPLLCMKPTGHPPFSAPSRRRLRRSPLYLEGGEKMLSAMRNLSVNPPPGGAAGGGRPFGPPGGLRGPRPAQCCRPGRGAPALRKPECSLSSPGTPFSSGRLESYQTSSGGQTARSCFQLRRGGEEREVLEPRAWSKTGREPTPSPFLKGVSGSRSGLESQRTGSHLPLKVGFIQSEHLY